MTLVRNQSPSFNEKIYQQNLKNAVRVKELELKEAHGKERRRLQAEKAALEDRLANFDKSFKKAQERIQRLETDLARASGAFSEKQQEEARSALAHGDFSKKADALFAEIEKQDDITIQQVTQRAASVVFSRGEIADQEVRWQDAAQRFTKAARLLPSYKHLRMAQNFTRRIGDYKEANRLGDLLVAAAIDEFSENNEQHATALNNYALSLQLDGQYDEAEPLYVQAGEIRKKTLGETHPDYATTLNNLAGLYQSQGRYDKAESLYQQAIAILEKSLGKNHPNTQKVKENYKKLLAKKANKR